MKSFEEIKQVIKKFPQAGGAGYVIALQLAKVADQTGLPGYDEFIEEWLDSSILKETTEAVPGEVSVMISWDGPPLIWRDGTLCLGIKRTMESIEVAGV